MQNEAHMAIMAAQADRIREFEDASDDLPVFLVSDNPFGQLELTYKDPSGERIKLAAVFKTKEEVLDRVRVIENVLHIKGEVRYELTGSSGLHQGSPGRS